MLNKHLDTLTSGAGSNWFDRPPYPQPVANRASIPSAGDVPRLGKRAIAGAAPCNVPTTRPDRYTLSGNSRQRSVKDITPAVSLEPTLIPTAALARGMKRLPSSRLWLDSARDIDPNDMLRLGTHNARNSQKTLAIVGVPGAGFSHAFDPMGHGYLAVMEYSDAQGIKYYYTQGLSVISPKHGDGSEVLVARTATHLVLQEGTPLVIGRSNDFRHPDSSTVPGSFESIWGSYSTYGNTVPTYGNNTGHTQVEIGVQDGHPYLQEGTSANGVPPFHPTQYKGHATNNAPY